MLLSVVSHIEQTERHLAQTGRGSHEVATLHDALDQFVGERFARLVMEGEGAQKLLLYGEVLHKLRRQFHEVPPHIGTAKALEAAL